MHFNSLPKTVCVLATLGFLGPLSAAEFSVNDVSDAVDADLEDLVCKTASGTCTLRAAVQQARKFSGTNITLPDGTYELTSGNEISITSRVNIQGGGAGKVVVSGKNSSRVFAIEDGAFATISGVTITHGNTAGDGGGVGVWRAKLSLVDAVISNNAANNGAGLSLSDSAVLLDNTTVSTNTADGFGGAVYIIGQSSSLTIRNSNVEQNSSISGGGVYCDTADNIQLENTVLNSNRSTGSDMTAGGGAIYNRECPVSLNQVTFDQNSAEKRGGALFNGSKGSFSIDNSIFSSNTAIREDGGAVYSDGSLTVRRASLTGNYATFGSALYDAGSSTLSMLTASGNSSRGGNGGAIYHNSNNSLVLKNSTVANNTGGNLSNALGNFQLKNSLIANAATGVDCTGSIISEGYNLDSDGTCGLVGLGDITSANPLLLALQDNGGSTLTHELGANSPAANAGSPDDCPQLDQRLYFRTDRCDIGAYEAGSASAQTGNISFDQAAVDMVRENVGVVTISLSRTAGNQGPVSIHYQDNPLSRARPNFDFHEFDGELEWADGESGDKSFQVRIINDTLAEGVESLILEINNPAGGVGIGATRTITINIADVSAQFGELAFDSASYTVAENAGSVDVTVQRSNGDAGEVSVAYTTVDKEASAGKDYSGVSGILNFAAGEISRTFSIPIINDSDKEIDKTFTLQLSDIIGGATAGQFSSAIVTIADDDNTIGGGSGNGTAGGGNTGNSGTGTETSSASSKGGGSLNLFQLLAMLGGLFLMRWRDR